MNRYLSAAGLLSAVLLTACDYEKDAVQDITVPPAASAIKFFNFGPGAPAVNFYANDQKVTAITSATGAESTNGVTYTNAGNGALYNGLNPGQYTFTARISATTDKDLAIASVQSTLADGKYYSYYVSGLYNTTAKNADAFIVEDPIPALDYTAAYVRFVNAISNAQPMTLNITTTTAPAVTIAVGGAVAYKAAGTFTAVPCGTYNLSTTVAGAATPAITRAGIGFNCGRVYTITSRGNMTVATGTNAPALDNTLNR
ncbi:MAG TPA: DUF4397 domain-containing protein [Gemmatimonadaceae bacterium]